MTSTLQAIPEHESFFNLYCRQYECTADDFEKDVLWRCMFISTAIPATLVWLVYKGDFEPDLILIHNIKNAPTFSELGDRVGFHSVQRNKKNYLRRWFRIRMSKGKLLELARSLFYD